MPPQLDEWPRTGGTSAVAAYALRMQLCPNCAATVGRAAKHRRRQRCAGVCLCERGFVQTVLPQFGGRSGTGRTGATANVYMNRLSRDKIYIIINPERPPKKKGKNLCKKLIIENPSFIKNIILIITTPTI